MSECGAEFSNIINPEVDNLKKFKDYVTKWSNKCQIPKSKVLEYKLVRDYALQLNIDIDNIEI